MRLLHGISIVLALMGTAALAQTQPPPEQPTTAPQDSPATVTLIEQGEAPHRQLRLTPRAGLRQSTEILVSQQMKITVDGQPMPMASMPGMKMVMEVVVRDVAENGDITMDLETARVEAVGQAPPDVGPLLKQMEGMTVHTVVDNRGVTKSARVDLPEGIDPAVKQQLQTVQQNVGQMSAPFPAEPVGVGAKWRVDQTITMNGITLTQTGTYELVRMDGDLIELAVRIVQHADEQDFQPPGMPPNATAHLESLDSEGTGRMVMRLPLVAVEEARIDLDMQMGLTMSTDQMVMNMEQEVEMTTDIKSEVIEGD